MAKPQNHICFQASNFKKAKWQPWELSHWLQQFISTNSFRINISVFRTYLVDRYRLHGQNNVISNWCKNQTFFPPYDIYYLSALRGNAKLNVKKNCTSDFAFMVESNLCDWHRYTFKGHFTDLVLMKDNELNKRLLNWGT